MSNEANGKIISSTALGLSKSGAAGVLIASLILVGFALWLTRPIIDTELTNTLQGIQGVIQSHTENTSKDNTALLLGIEKLKSSVDALNKSVEQNTKIWQQRASVNVDSIQP